MWFSQQYGNKYSCFFKNSKPAKQYVGTPNIKDVASISMSVTNTSTAHEDFFDRIEILQRDFPNDRKPPTQVSRTMTHCFVLLQAAISSEKIYEKKHLPVDSTSIACSGKSYLWLSYHFSRRNNSFLTSKSEENWSANLLFLWRSGLGGSHPSDGHATFWCAIGEAVRWLLEWNFAKPRSG